MTTATTIIYFIASLAVGDKFMWNEPGNLTFEVVGITQKPEAGFAGKRLAPYATVVWSDDNGKPSGLSLQSIESDVRSGQLIPMVD